MITLNIDNKEYKVKFGYNSFCDTDLMERTTDLLGLLSKNIEGDFSQTAVKLFSCVRELLFVGFKKFNPVSSLEEVGDLLDIYLDEAPEGEERGIMALFAIIVGELTTQGFFGGLMKNVTDVVTTISSKKSKKN